MVSTVEWLRGVKTNVRDDLGGDGTEAQKLGVRRDMAALRGGKPSNLLALGVWLGRVIDAE